MNRIQDSFLRKVMLTVFCAAAFGLAFGHLAIKPSYVDLIVDSTESQAVRFTNHIKDKLVSSGFFAGGNVRTGVEDHRIQEIMRTAGDFTINKIKIFSSEGVVLFSTEKEEVGEKNSRDYFRNIVARGKIYTKLVRKNTRSAEDKQVSTDVVETYVPVMDNGSFTGAVEVYYDISAEYSRLQSILAETNVLVLGLTGVYLAIIVALLFRLDAIITERKQINEELQQKNTSLAVSKSEIEEHRNQLDATLEYLSRLFREVLLTRKLQVRYDNPSLVKCYEKLGCNTTDCPCHGREAVRCWQFAGTYCLGESQGTYAAKHDDCMQCEVFQAATSDPLSRMGELFNNMMHVIASKQLELERTNAELQQALDEINTLRGIVPICCHCKNIRDDRGFWNRVETYVEEHTDARFSHGICPDCQRKFYPDLEEDE